jgi:methylaspartate ammonia-lyase
VGKEISSFKDIAEKVDTMTNPETGKKLHTAVRYGVTQALLHAVALSNKTLMANVVANEYGTKVSEREIPIFTQSGDLRYENVDKMILKKAGVLPHGLINNVPEKLGHNGEKLIEYVSFLKNRIKEIGSKDYTPSLHIDVYGTIAMAFDNDYNKMVDYFEKLNDASGDLLLRIEGPIDKEEREAQVEALATLTRMVDERMTGFSIVADEWCNTFDDIKYFADNKAGHMLQIKTPDLGGVNNIADAVLYCKSKGIGAYQGGTCNETDRSAQVCVHIAMATSPDLMLAKPGMGVDEGFMIVYNEMQRILQLSRRL